MLNLKNTLYNAANICNIGFILEHFCTNDKVVMQKETKGNEWTDIEIAIGNEKNLN